MSWDNVGPNQCHMDGTPINRGKDKGSRKMQEKHDFGFSIVDETELDIFVKHNDKAEKLRAMIMPLLNNLKANPDKDIIKWQGTDRVRRIDEFINKMNELVDD